MEQEAAVNYLRSVKAKYIAEAGINKAIAELKLDAKTNFVYSVATKNYLDEALYENCASYSVEIKDEQRKVNINYANKELLKGLLGDEAKADAVINYRNTNGQFKTIEEIKFVTGIDDTTYEDIKNDITVYSYLDLYTIDDKGADEPRCPININTASDKVLRAVLSPLGATGADITAIKDNRPFSDWTKFNDLIDDLDGVSDEIKNDIKNNCNPNRQKPLVYTTDFCFYSGGKYTLTSKGILYDSTTKTNKLAEKQVKVVVYVYDILNQTKKTQFEADDSGNPLTLLQQYQTKKAFKVTTLDSCPFEPMNSGNDWTNESNYTTLSDSIKIGFWENFDEEINAGIDLNYRLSTLWQQGNAYDEFAISTWPGVTSYKLHQGNGSWSGIWPITDLGNRDSLEPYLTWSYFGCRIEITDGSSGITRSQFGEGPQGPQDGTIPFPPGFPSSGSNDEKNAFCSTNPHKYGWFMFYPKYNDQAGGGWEDELRPWAVGQVVFRRKSSAEQDEHHGFYRCFAKGEASEVGNGPGFASEGTQYEVHIIASSGEIQPQSTVLSPYEYTKDHYIVVAQNNLGRDDFYFYFRNRTAMSFKDVVFSSGDSTLNISTYSNQREGLIGVFGGDKSEDGWGETAPNHTKLYVDNLRIIPASPDPLRLETYPGSTDPDENGSAYFISNALDVNSTVSWGTIWGTVSITGGGNTNSERVTFQTSIDGGTTWSPNGNSIAPGQSIQSNNSNTIKYRAVFQTLDNSVSGYGTLPYYSETVALEDVFITYLPQTEVLYWREVAD